MDIGGTKIAAVVAKEDGTVVSRQSEPTRSQEGPDAILGRLRKLAVAALIEAKTAPAELSGIGISCGGPLDIQTGVIYSPPNLPGWEALPIRDLCQGWFPNVPIFLDNDANATALAEWRYGAGRGAQNVVFLTMGTGIGGGLILDGRLYRGTNDLAGEVGHQTILINGPLCGCGKRGCLEALASGPAIARLARENLSYGRGKALLALADGEPDNVTAQHVVEAAKAGDSFSKGILVEAGTYMGIGLANLIQILNPERIILGTIAVHAGDLILDPIREAVEEYAWNRSAAVCRIVPAELGDRAQDLAAISLAIP